MESVETNNKQTDEFEENIKKFIENPNKFIGGLPLHAQVSNGVSKIVPPKSGKSLTANIIIEKNGWGVIGMGNNIENAEEYKKTNSIVYTLRVNLNAKEFKRANIF